MKKLEKGKPLQKFSTSMAAVVLVKWLFDSMVSRSRKHLNTHLNRIAF
jgi:hypothetical protein